MTVNKVDKTETGAHYKSYTISGHSADLTFDIYDDSIVDICMDNFDSQVTIQVTLDVLQHIIADGRKFVQGAK